MAKRGSRAKKKKSKRLARKRRLRKAETRIEPEKDTSVVPCPGLDWLLYVFCRRLNKPRKDGSSQDGELDITEKVSSVTSGISSNSPDVPVKDEHDDSATAGMDSNPEQDAPVWDFCACAPIEPGIAMMDDVDENDEIPQETTITAQPAIETQDAQAQETSTPTPPVGESVQPADSTQSSRGDLPQPELVSSEVVDQPTSSDILAPSFHTQQMTFEADSSALDGGPAPSADSAQSSQAQESTPGPTPTVDDPSLSVDSAEPSQQDGGPLERMPSRPVGESMLAEVSSSSSRPAIPQPPEVPTVRNSVKGLLQIAGIIGFNSAEVVDTFGELGGPRDGNDNRLSITITGLIFETSKMTSTVKNRPMTNDDRWELSKLVVALEVYVSRCEWMLQKLWMELEELTMEKNLMNEVRMGYANVACKMWETGEFLKDNVINFKRHIIHQAASVNAGMTLKLIYEEPEAESLASEG